MISIIVPVYNRADVIASCVQSLRNQTYSNLEIILSDDGSEDETLRLLVDFAGIDQRIRVISNRHRGPSAARNAGLVAAKGEYIGFLDSDDVIAPDMMERMYGNLRLTGADLTCCRFRLEESTENPFAGSEGTLCVAEPWQAFEQMLVNEGQCGYGVSPGTKLCRRKVIMQPTMMLFDEDVQFGEDTMWIAGVLERCKSVVMDSTVMMRYSFGCANSICRNVDTRTRLIHAGWKLNCLKEHGCSEKAIQVIEQEERALMIRLLLGK